LTESNEVSEEGNWEARVSSEPCKPTTSICSRPTHFVRRKRREVIRSAVVPVRFSPDERDRLKGFAEARRLSLSDFIRRVALGRKLPQVVSAEINRQVYVELARIGNNLNQMVRAANGGMFKVADMALLTRLAEVVRQLGLTFLQGRA